MWIRSQKIIKTGRGQTRIRRKIGGYFLNESAPIRVCPRPVFSFLILDFYFQPIFLKFELLLSIRVLNNLL